MRTWRVLTAVELKLFLREPMTVIFTLALPLIILYILNGVFGNTPDPQGEVYRGYGPADWYTPAFIGLVLVAVGVLSLPVHLAGYRERGVLRRFEASSIPRWALLSAHLVVTVVVGTVGAVLLTTLSVLGYDASLPESWVGTALAFLVVVLTFSAFGVLLGALFRTARAAQGAGLLLFFVMMFLSGAGPPPEVLPQTLQTIGEWLPLTYAAELLRMQWLEGRWDLAALAVVGALAVVSAALAWRLLARE